MKNKNIAGIFAFFFGIFGVHRFYLGQVGLGIFYLFFFWTGIPAIIGFIDALIFFSMDQDDFDYKYNKRKLYPDHQRYDTDFSREDRRRMRDEERIKRQERRTQRRQQVRDYSKREQPQRKSTPSVVRINNPFKAAGIQKYKEYDFDGAIESFKKALSVNPSDIAVHFNMACAYSLNEEKENAFFHLSKAVELGFVDFKKIQEHDALAYLRIQDEYEIFRSNGYRLNVPPKPQTIVDEPAPSIEEIEDESANPPEDLLSKNSALLDQIKRLGELREKGLLTDAEFEAQKRKLLD